MKIFIRLAFFGQNYYGSQKLPHDPTIQGEFEFLLQRIYQEPIKVTISSRLDRGVHALDFALTFDTENTSISISHLAYYLRRSASQDITIKDVRVVDDSFSPRYSCRDKQYLYLIQDTEKKNPLLNPFTYTPEHVLEEEKIKETLMLFQGEHEFKYFATPEENDKTVLDIESVDFRKDDDIIKLRFKAKSFLRYQVRFMVGACISVAKGELTKDDIRNRLNGKMTGKIKYKAQPQGLILERIDYPDIPDPMVLKHLLFL